MSKNNTFQSISFVDSSKNNFQTQSIVLNINN